MRALKAEGLITAAHDLSDGGLAVAAAEMALAADAGVRIDADPELGAAAWFFGEDQGALPGRLRRRRRRCWRAPPRPACPPAPSGASAARRAASAARAVALAALRAAHADCLPRLIDALADAAG